LGAPLFYNADMAQLTADQSANDSGELLPYRLRDQFLTTPEIVLYRALRDMAQDRYVVFAKVALTDIVYIVRPNENVHYFSKLFRKHVDFLLCSPQTLKPQIGIELVRTLPPGGTRSADQFIEDLFLTAGLPLVQVAPDDHYEIAHIVALFQAALRKVQQVKRRMAGIPKDAVPMCPVCGKMMVLRTHRTGSSAGQLYYGCIDNPSCRGTAPVK
jgi:hypothetical protein